VAAREQLRVMIVGAGVAGSSMAVALRAAGHHVSVFDKAATPGMLTMGGAIHLWGNAMRALAELGLADEVVAAGTRIERAEFQTASGRHIATWPLDALARELKTPPDTGLSRSVLQAMLVQAAGDGVIETGAEAVGFDEDDSGVTLRLADGRELRGDVLIAADGLRSELREALLGQSKLRYAGYHQWQGFVSDGSGLHDSLVDLVMFGTRQRTVMHHIDRGSGLFWAVVVYGREGTLDAGDATKNMLLERFGGWGGSIVPAIEATPGDKIVGTDVYDRPPVTRWCTARVVLAGDAAHPLTTNLGQGANLAIEDAVVMARCLETEADVPAALEAYQAVRIKRTTPVVKASRRIAKMGTPPGRVLSALRNSFFKVMMPRVGVSSHRSLVADFVGWVDGSDGRSVHGQNS
jgi:2-polyprenyl-6-methoxyphenol hydroxylase-like FAD-dependent oxidoreductase